MKNSLPKPAAKSSPRMRIVHREMQWRDAKMPDLKPQRRGSAGLYIVGILAVLIAGVMAFVLFTRQRTHVEAASKQLTTEGEKGPSVQIATVRKIAGSDTLR